MWGPAHLRARGLRQHQQHWRRRDLPLADTRTETWLESSRAECERIQRGRASTARYDGARWTSTYACTAHASASEVSLPLLLWSWTGTPQGCSQDYRPQEELEEGAPTLFVSSRLDSNSFHSFARSFSLTHSPTTAHALFPLYRTRVCLHPLHPPAFASLFLPLRSPNPPRP